MTPDQIKQRLADAGLQVTPLVWQDSLVSNGKRQITYAVTPLVTYRITQKFFPETFFSIELVDGGFLSATTFELAKAAAQADHERRIYDALQEIDNDPS